VINEAESRTAENQRFLLQVAFNYGARADIADAAKALVRDVGEGLIQPEDITEEAFGQRLATGGNPPPDLIVRTSGEQRLSNFLLWEAAYAEFVFQDIYWPDYGSEALRAAVDEYHRRTRRYGGADVDDVLATG